MVQPQQGGLGYDSQSTSIPALLTSCISVITLPIYIKQSLSNNSMCLFHHNIQNYMLDVYQLKRITDK